MQYAVEQIDLVKNMIRKYPDVFKYATSVSGKCRDAKWADLFGQGRVLEDQDREPELPLVQCFPFSILPKISLSL